MPDREQILRDGLETLGLPLEDRQIHALFAYLALLQQWNHAYNLTAIRDPEMMVTHHLLDSLSIARRVKGMRIIDVGTGPGLPGIPLAICFPERQFTLLDSNGKKTRFLFQVKTTLGLDNVQQLQSRAEAYRPEQPFDAVVSRAFTSLAGMTESCAHLLSKHGRFYAMKGQYPEQELSELPKHYNVVGSHRLVVPGIEGHRHLIEIAPA